MLKNVEKKKPFVENAKKKKKKKRRKKETI